MSRHSYTFEREDQSIEVLMGWDRPLQQVFMVVEARDAEEGYLYSNLEARNPETLTLEDFRQALAELQIQVPESMFVETEIDRRMNAGNRFVIHQANGEFKTISQG